jgi:hypothetical protein
MLIYDKTIQSGNIQGYAVWEAPVFSFDYEFIMMSSTTEGVYTTKVAPEFPNQPLTEDQVTEVMVFVDEFLNKIAEEEKAKLDEQKLAEQKAKEEEQKAKEEQSEFERKQAIFDSEPYKSDREYRQYLKDTDWYVVRKYERGIEIPEDIATKRLEAVNNIKEAPLNWDEL